ncbi:hypothetical protein QQG55_47040 [Brugia pahangi]
MKVSPKHLRKLTLNEAQLNIYWYDWKKRRSFAYCSPQCSPSFWLACNVSGAAWAVVGVMTLERLESW